MAKADVPAEYITESHGVRLACNVDPSTLGKFKDCLLDFFDGHFVFIETSMSGFLE